MTFKALPHWLRATQPWIVTPFAGAAGGALAQWLHCPLPWMIGALLGVTLIRCLGCLTKPVPHGVKLGQWIVATGIGLHFTAAVVGQMLQNAGVIILASVLTVVTCGVGIWLHRRSGVDLATAYFASMPGGANEMVNLGRRQGADLASVAAGQSLRMMLVLLTVPASYLLIFGGEAHTHTNAPVHLGWLSLLFAIGGLIAWRFQRWHLPNAWQLGALTACIPLTAFFDLQVGLPPGAGAFGQWLIGSTLGCYFDRSFFKRAPAFMLRTLAGTCSIMLLAIPLAWILGRVSGLDIPTLALGMAPGGIAEMSLTAEALGLMVPLVTAIQVLRLLMVLFLAEPVFRVWVRLRSKSSDA